MSLVKVAFVPSWYPSVEDPVRGHFFVRHVEALSLEHDVLVVSPARGRSLPSFVAEVVRRLTALRPEVVHAHVAVPAGAAALAARPFSRAPVVLTEHSGPLGRLFGDSAARARLVRSIFGRVDELAIPSRALEPELQALGVTRSPIVLPNPVPDRGAGQPEELSFVAVGLMDDRTKGFEHLLRGWSEFVRNTPAARLKIVGDGLHAGEYRALAAALDVDSSVTFAGAQPPDAVVELLRRADAYVSASVYETFGYALVEAASLGTPAIATSVGVAPEVVTDAAGILVPPSDASALAAGLRAFVVRRAAIDRAELRRRTLETFGFAAVCRRTSELYLRAVESRGRRNT